MNILKPLVTSLIAAMPVQVFAQATSPEGELALGIWYSQAEEFSGTVSVEKERIFGTDETFVLSSSISKFSKGFVATSTDPDFYESPYSRQLSFALFNKQPDNTQNGDYAFSGAEARVSFGREFDAGYATYFGLGVSETKLGNGASLPVFISDYLIENGERNTATFAFFDMVWGDVASQGGVPIGYRVSLENELGRVEGTTYAKARLSGHHYSSLSDILGLHVKGSIAKGVSQGVGTYPIFERFQAGGPASVRGYGQNTLGPTSAIPGSTEVGYTGGTISVSGGVEISTRVNGREDLSLHTFFDMGNVFDDADTVSLSGLRQSVGVGLQWDSPVGPVRVSFAQPLNDQAGDMVEEFQLTLGTSF